MKEKINKFSEYYFGVEEIEEEKSPSFPFVINGIKVPQCEIVPEPKLNLEVKVEKPIEDIEYIDYDKRYMTFLNILLIIFIAFLVLLTINGITIELQLKGIL